jgi:(1->4)-alpha-D-glucan 1-alpha-D-glucosylmutase
MGSSEFMAELESFVDMIAEPGRINSLAQTLLKLTAPGVPDTYQGSELWDLHLVDPDNRGAIDFDSRRKILAELEKGVEVEKIIHKSATGMTKMWVIHQALALRQSHPERFGPEAAYIPLAVSGAKMKHVVAYLRGDTVATVVPRWNLKLGRGWGATRVTLPQGHWKNVLTGDRVAGGEARVQLLLSRFPVGLFTKEQE